MYLCLFCDNSILKMIAFKRIRHIILSSNSFITILLIHLLLVVTSTESVLGSSLVGTQNCKEMEVSYQVVNDSNGGTDKSIVIDLKQIEKSSVIISLVGPNKFFLKDVNENEIKNLKKGTYSLVIVGRSESSEYCPKHFQVIIQ